MHFANNLRLLRKRKRLSQEEVAAVTGLKRTTLTGYEKGTAQPNFETLIRLSEFFDISLDNLLKSDLSALPEGRIALLERENGADITGARLRILATTVGEDNEENIELVPLKVRAGYTNGHADPEFIKFLSSFRMPFLDRNKKYRTFQISGDSMPPVSDGDWVTGEFLQNWELLKNGYPYIILTRDEGIVFKMVYSKVRENGTLLLCSTNPAYEPYEVPVEEVLEVWKFTHYISSQMARNTFR